MKILVTGANGMLGQDLCPILEDEGHEIVETDIHNLDITNEQEVIKVFLDILTCYFNILFKLVFNIK